jgi:hypothetical protein
MSQTRITELTPEQQALIPIIRDEWIKIALDTSPTDKQKAESAIRLAYSSCGLKQPHQILWFDNPLDAVNSIVANQYTEAEDFSDFFSILEKKIVYFAIEATVEITVKNILFSDFGNISRYVSDIFDSVWDACDEQFIKDNRNFIESIIYGFNGRISQVEELAFYAYLQAIGVDCSELKGMWKAAKERGIWWAFKDVNFSQLRGMWEAAKHCGFWWAFKDIAVATPKPSVICLDNGGRLHAEGKPAVSYEGFNVYAYHGVRLPEKYGQLHPNEWQPRWLLEEDNAELRRVLIQGIGYARICQELQAVELDYWREYVLLGIEESIDVEPIYLLKMTCPSTGYVHVLRVPPSVNSAREAIRWVISFLNA